MQYYDSQTRVQCPSNTSIIINQAGFYSEHAEKSSRAERAVVIIFFD